MLVDLQQVPPEGQVVDRTLGPSSLSFDAREFELSAPVQLTGRLVKTDEGAYRLQGALTTELRVACVRCLEPVTLGVREDLKLLYLPQSENVAQDGEDDHGLGDEELAVGFYRDEQIDLTHMIWEQIVLAVPMKPICKPDCQGLCPDCGVNRNVSECACVPDTIDPRWQSLKGLLES